MNAPAHFSPRIALENRLKQAVSDALGPAHADTDPLVRPAADPRFGDYQANLAMSLARQLGRKPQEVAKDIIAHFDNSDGFLADLPGVAGPGFINLKLSTHALAQSALAMAADPDLGIHGQHSKRVVIDYSAPNVAKEMHIGHLRSTILGDALARTLESLGCRVIRQNHIGDWGTQFGRVMLGLWYEAVAITNNYYSLDKLDAWIDAANKIPKSSAKEASEDRAVRLKAEHTLLKEIAGYHRSAYKDDANGESYFTPYLKYSFPKLDRLQSLYTFATTITGLESAKDYELENQHGFNVTLASLPSLIATFVQQPESDRNKQEKTAWEKSVDVTVRSCQSIYEKLGVLLTPDDIRGESKYNDDLPGVIGALEMLGVLRESAGAKVVFPEGFRGREAEPLPMIVQKSDGGYLYATTDLAAARYRIDTLEAERIIYVTDARQAQHFAMVFQVLRQTGWAGQEVRLDHVPFGTIMGADRKPFKTRSGDTIKLADVLDEAIKRAGDVIASKNPDLPPEERERVARVVGIGSVKYADLSNDRVKDYVFDWDRMLSFEGNTAPYLLYSYARIRSIFRKGEVDFAGFANENVSVTEPAERGLVLQLLQFEDTVASVGESLEPHRLCNYLYELATRYHRFFEHCPVLKAEDAPTREARLALCKLTALTLERGLDLLGIRVVERM